ncbi:unnamed protein product [Urochloa humidicola]
MAIGAAARAAAADAVVTFMWVLCASALGATTAAVTSFLGLQDSAAGGYYPLLVTASLLACLLFAFDLLCGALGGASFNPTDFAASYAAGLDTPSLFSVALRFPAQAAGAVGGALAISELMPAEYKHTLAAAGPSLKVDPHTGAAAEGVLTFVITLAVLWIIVKGPRNTVIRTLLLAVSIVSLILAGAEYTGPSMNPANLYVYWICPLIGAMVAGWVFRAVFLPPAPKPKTKKA